MDDIERLLEDIRKDPELQGVEFTTSFLNNVADVYERHGPGTARAYLLDRQGRREMQGQAKGALRVLDILARSPHVASNRCIGRLILKSLPNVLGVRSKGG